MKWSVWAAIVLFILGGIGIYGYKYGAPVLQERSQVQTSDAAKLKGTIKIGTDNFIGYAPLCSPYLRSLMRSEGYAVDCIDDKAQYANRMEKLRSGEIQFAVATIDSYELNAVKAAYPGLMVSVIDVSQGADALVSCTSSIRNIDDLKRPGIKIAFTPASPSEYLIKANAVRFDIPRMHSSDKTWRIDTDGSPEAAKKCSEGVAQVAALWEPDVTKLLRSNPNAKKILGTENTSRLIVDVLIARRDFARDYSDVVKALLGNYFKTLHFYAGNPDIQAEHYAQYADIKPELVKDVIKGVAWVNLGENALLWYGVAEGGKAPQYGLIEATESTLKILIDSDDFPQGNPLPKQDASSIVYGAFIEELYKSGLSSGEKIDLKSGDSLSREFTELTDEEWSKLREVGTLRGRQVYFPPGSDSLSVSAKEEVDQIAEAIKSYPNFRIVVEGHTGTRGDPQDNLELSRDRAEAVARYLEVTYRVSENRIRAVGFGGQKPLKQNIDESDRQYQSRLARVVVKLVTEAY